MAVLCVLPCRPAPAQQPTVALPDAGYELLYSKGVLAYNQRRYADAEALLRRALDARPDAAAASLRLGATLNRLEHYAEALEQLERVEVPEPDRADREYELGLAHYGLGQYKQAAEALERSVRGDPSDPMAHYYLGLALHRQGAYGAAVPHLLRAAAMAPELAAVAQFYAGVGLYRQGLTDEAGDAFTQVLAAEPDPALAGAAQEFLDRIAADREGERPYFAEVSGMFQHDSNVVLLAGGSVLPSGISQKDDNRWVLFASAGRNARHSGWGVDGVYRVYQSFHQDLTAFDVQNHEGELGLDYGWARTRARLGYRFDLTQVASDTYLSQHRLSPSLTWRRWAQTWTLRYEVAFLNFRDTPSAPGNDVRDGIDHVVALEVARRLAGEGRLRLGYAFNNRLSGSSALENDWSYLGNAVSADLAIVPRPRWRAELEASYDIQRYGHANQASPTGASRYDGVAQVQITGSRVIGGHMGLALQFLYVRDDSNVPSYDYRREIVSLIASGAF